MSQGVGHDSQDHSGRQGGNVGLIEIGAHARDISDVVPNVVRYNRRIPGVVLGNPSLHLAHQIGPYVGTLGENPAAHPQE